MEEATIQQAVDLQTVLLEHVMNLRMSSVLSTGEGADIMSKSSTDLVSAASKSSGDLLSREQVEKIKKVRRASAECPCPCGRACACHMALRSVPDGSILAHANTT